MSNPYEVKPILSKLLAGETVDGLFFWGPKLMMSTDNSRYDEVYLIIEGLFTITENGKGTTVTPQNPDKMTHLCRLAFQKISSAQLDSPNTLNLQFESGIQLEVFGENEQFEGWQLEAKEDEQPVLMIVAGPFDQLTVFE